MSPLPRRTFALTFEAPHRAVWKEIDLPGVQPHEVLVKVFGISTCPHWDIHMMDGEPMFPGSTLSYPLSAGLPGHEAMGEVVAVGEKVSRFAPGMCVAAWRDPGNRSMGCYAQYVSLNADDLLEIDQRFQPEEIASLELAMCVQSSFDRLLAIDALGGNTLAISGLGPSGLVAVQLARAYGVRKVVAFDPLPDRRTLALSLGADEAWDPTSYLWPVGRVGRDLFDAALDTTGVPAAIEQLMGATRETVAMFGVLRETVRVGPEHWWGGFALLGYGTHTRSAAERVYELILGGKLSLVPLITRRLPFSRYAEGVEALRRKEATKILFDPWA